MKKTSVYLTNDEAEGLQRAARTAGRPQAELIREGIRRVISDTNRGRTFHSLGKGRGGGRPIERWSSDAVYRKVIGER